MEVSSTAPLELAVALVNAVTPGERGGHPYPEPTGALLRDAVGEAVADRPNRARVWADASDAEHEALAALAGRLREVFEAADAAQDDPADEVAPLVQALLRDAPVHPVLADHDGEAWHLHAHADEAGPAEGVAAICALGLATVVASGSTDRLGCCDASSCDRVYVDTSRNGSKRFCSPACQARAKTAAFRARRS